MDEDTPMEAAKRGRAQGNTGNAPHVPVCTSRGAARRIRHLVGHAACHTSPVGQTHQKTQRAALVAMSPANHWDRQQPPHRAGRGAVPCRAPTDGAGTSLGRGLCRASVGVCTKPAAGEQPTQRFTQAGSVPASPTAP